MNTSKKPTRQTTRAASKSSASQNRAEQPEHEQPIALNPNVSEPQSEEENNPQINIEENSQAEAEEQEHEVEMRSVHQTSRNLMMEFRKIDRSFMAEKVKYPLPPPEQIWSVIDKLPIPHIDVDTNPNVFDVLDFLDGIQAFPIKDHPQIAAPIMSKAFLGATGKQ